MPKHHLSCPIIPLPSQMWTSSPSSISRPLPQSSNTSSKTMEEVWEDIAFAPDLNHHPSTRGVILQDFFSKDPPPTTASPSGFSASPPPPPTMLTLSSGPDRFNALLMQPHHRIQPISPGSTAVPDDTGGGGWKKRTPEFERSSGDHRFKSMIKNRESAARSRARKKAYTNELELELAQLLEENAKLKKQQEQLCRAATAEHHGFIELQQLHFDTMVYFDGN